MIAYWIIDESTCETHRDFAKRLNADIDAYRDANLVVNYIPIPGGPLTIYARIGADEPVQVGQGQFQMSFKDLSEVDVEKRMAARKAALARGPSSVLRPDFKGE